MNIDLIEWLEDKHGIIFSIENKKIMIETDSVKHIFSLNKCQTFELIEYLKELIDVSEEIYYDLSERGCKLNIKNKENEKLENRYNYWKNTLMVNNCKTIEDVLQVLKHF